MVMRDEEPDETKAHHRAGFFELFARRTEPTSTAPRAVPRPHGGRAGGRPPFLEAGGHEHKACLGAPHNGFRVPSSRVRPAGAQRTGHWCRTPVLLDRAPWADSPTGRTRLIRLRDVERGWGCPFEGLGDRLMCRD